VLAPVTVIALFIASAIVGASPALDEVSTVTT